MKTDIQSTNSSISDEMCRLCLNHCDDENSVEIFFSNDLSLTVRIMACAGLEVSLLLVTFLSLQKQLIIVNISKNDTR